jgi:hypothetical protein
MAASSPGPAAPTTVGLEDDVKFSARALRKLARARTVRPFFSSTFNDFRDEREHLTKNVWPIFEQICKEKGYMYVPIDLRWGITAEQSADGQTIKICLNQVEQSRPFFITMLGERCELCWLVPNPPTPRHPPRGFPTPHMAQCWP